MKLFRKLRDVLHVRAVRAHVADYSRLVEEALARGVKIRAWKEEMERVDKENEERKRLERTTPMDGY